MDDIEQPQDSMAQRFKSGNALSYEAVYGPEIPLSPFRKQKKRHPKGMSLFCFLKGERGISVSYGSPLDKTFTDKNDTENTEPWNLEIPWLSVYLCDLIGINGNVRIHYFTHPLDIIQITA